jgi:lysozyme inhibitor LprI
MGSEEARLLRAREESIRTQPVRSRGKSCGGFGSKQVYQQIIKKYSDQPEFLKKMREARRIWLQLRNVELRMMYPLNRDAYGTVQPMCEASIGRNSQKREPGN